MRTFLALIRKNVLEVRWMFFLIGLALFWLCWLFVFVPHRIETRGRGQSGVSTIELEMQFWDRVPLFILFLSIWSITRGTALAGEIERGTMDLIMSRPVRRSTYLFTHLLVGTLGLVGIVAAMLAGNQCSAHYNTLREPPTLLTLSKPALNLVALGWAIYGYTFMISTMDLVRWRPILIASVATLAGYMAHIVANTPLVSEDYKWIDRLSIFRACRLIEVATTGETLVFNVSILGAIGLAGIVIGFIAFSRRDLPAGS
jgi:ABC-2 type transport system permease protein